MKKNISINLFGTLYAIDEDAYELLDRYLESMKRYFSSKEGGDEIADDIEHRVAELLWEKKNKGNEVVDIKTVREIIETIGNASEIADGEGEKVDSEKYEAGSSCEKADNSFKAENTGNVSRRLFRSEDDKKLGGVCAGLASYFHCKDSSILRIALIVLELLALFGSNSPFVGSFCGNVALWLPLIYLILWVILPVANNAEDKLRMKGEEVTPENINRVIIDESSNTSRTTNNGGCLKAILIFIIILLCLPFVLGLIALLFGLSIASFVLPSILQIPFLMDNNNGVLITNISDGGYQNTSLLIISGVVFLLITIYGLIRFVRTNKKKLNNWVVASLIVLWILSIFGMIYGSGKTLEAKFSNLTNIIGRKVARKSHVTTSKTAFASNEDDFLQTSNFYIIDNNCTEDRCTDNRHGFFGSGMYYLDACNNNGLIYTAEHQEKVEPGIYRLKVAVRSDGEGAFVFVRRKSTIRDHYSVDDSLLITRKMLAYGSDGGTLWKWASGYMNSDSANILDSIGVAERNKIVEANDKKGNGWSYIVIDDIEIKEGDGNVYYGFTTNPQFTGEQPRCTWASATDFTLYKKDSNGNWARYDKVQVKELPKVKPMSKSKKKVRKPKKSSVDSLAVK